MKINPLACLRSENKIILQEAYQCQVTTHFEWDPLDAGIILTDLFIPTILLILGL